MILAKKRNFFTGIVALIFVPESPYFLAWKKKSIEAARPR